MGYDPSFIETRSTPNGLWLYHVVYVLFMIAVALMSLLRANQLAIFCLYLTGISIMWKFPFDIKHLITFLFPTRSRSVYSIRQSKKPQRTVVFSGHLDTAKRTESMKKLQLFYSFMIDPQLHSKRFDRNLNIFLPNMLRTPVISGYIFIYLVPLFILLNFGNTFENIFFVLFLLMMLLGLISAVQPIFSKFVPGALDNGSGAALVMSLASEFTKIHLNHTDLVFINNGSEESSTKSLGEILNQLNLNKKTTYVINFDSIGSKHLVAGYAESNDFGKTIYYDTRLFKFLDKFISQNQEFKDKVRVGYIPASSDAHDAISKGFRVMTSFFSLSEHTFPKQYHQMSDTLEKINWETIELNKNLIVSLIKQIDSLEENL